ncbi:hypothetical protein GGI21_004354 [Coemansia aciculifera]|nr:hypothetical protein GGI21_004354 [Coemansia aciculifera]
MDINVAKRPFPLRGVHWSIANRWIIGTRARVFIVTPECVMAGDTREKREVSAALEATSSIEAVCLLEPLQSSSSCNYDYALGVLASDSSLRLFVPPIGGRPDYDNWVQVGCYRSPTAAGSSDLLCAIDCVPSGMATAAAAAAGKEEEVVVGAAACGFMSGRVEVVGLRVENGGEIATKRALDVDAGGGHAVCHVAWVDGGSSDRLLLLVCAVDGRAGLWQIHRDLSQATLLATIGLQDWRPFTAHCVSGGRYLVLAKIGTAAAVDVGADSVPPTAIQYTALGVSQTIISCVIDERRERIYVAAADFCIYVLSKQGDASWSRRLEEERALRDGMRKTVEKSFTTPFKMSSLVLRSLTLSPNARYLAFAAE